VKHQAKRSVAKQIGSINLLMLECKVVDWAGFEPAASTMPAPRLDSNIDGFRDFLAVNMRLEPSTVRANAESVKRFLVKSNYEVSYENVKRYLEGYLHKKAKTYNSEITNLRRFIRDYLQMPQLIMSFKMAPVDECHYNDDLISKVQVRRGFYGFKDVRAKAIYLFAATTGLRKSEILKLSKQQTNPETRTVIPMHFTRKKRSGITFYNKEAALWLEKYRTTRKDGSERLFAISDRAWRKIWRDSSKNAGARITAKVLRVWFSTELGEHGVPDRFVDVFQGRAPRSVLAKHYTGRGLERLKRIYDKANLKVLKQTPSVRSWNYTPCVLLLSLLGFMNHH
jgi:integrase